MKKNNIIKIGAVVLVLAIGGIGVSRAMAGPSQIPVGYTELHPTDLVNSISIKGIVESVEKRNVYSTLGFKIKNVAVSVGDKVTEGQVLCELDTEDLELNIAQSRAELDVSQQSSLNTLENNQRIYNEAAANLRNGTNSQVLSAESSFKSAQTSLETAQKNYKDALEDYENTDNSQLLTAQSNLNAAKLDLDTKTTTYENNKVLYNAGTISQNAFTLSETDYTNAQNKYNDALTNYNNAQTTQKRTLVQSENALKAAQTTYNNAKSSLDSARVSAGQDLEKYASNVEGSQITSNIDSKLIALQKLEKQKADSVIKAPVAGTVTAVYAKEGAAGSGLMFVIEDTEHLKITTRIKEYDAGKVTTGMNVTIKSDSTGDTIYDGVVNKIDPAAIKNAAGETASSSDVEFGAEVNVISAETALRVGMNTRLNVILEQKQGVFCVPYDAIATDAEGNSVIYIADSSTANHVVAKAVSVTQGLETDFYVEITGDGLADGMRAVNDASAMTNGMEITLK